MTYRPIFSNSPTRSEFHRRRAERELDHALSASSEETALRHLELARLHHRRRSASPVSRQPADGPPIFRTDKEA